MALAHTHSLTVFWTHHETRLAARDSGLSQARFPRRAQNWNPRLCGGTGINSAGWQTASNKVLHEDTSGRPCVRNMNRERREKISGLMSDEKKKLLSPDHRGVKNHCVFFFLLEKTSQKSLKSAKSFIAASQKRTPQGWPLLRRSPNGTTGAAI